MAKGFELQFNWIFVLIAGAILMSFFFVLIKNQISIGETGSARNAQQDLNFVLKVSQGVSSTEKLIAFNKPIEFTCSDVSEYRVIGSDVSGRFDYQAIYAPSVLHGRELIVGTSSFRSPYRVMSLAYVTNKDVDHVFVGSDPLVLHLYSLMPKNSSRRLISSLAPDYPDDGYDEVVFVMNASEFSSVSSLAEFDARPEKVKFVVITYDPVTAGAYGTVGFYSYDGALRDDGTYPFMEAELLLGAVIGHGSDIYTCNLHKVIQRINMLSKLHKSRVDRLSGNPDCDGYYSSLSAALENVRVVSDAWPITNDGMRGLYEDSTDLGNINTQITQRTSCTPLY